MFSSNTSQVAATATQAEAIDFDGTNDYLSRSSTLIGATDTQTLTFSGWIWLASGSQTVMLQEIQTTDGNLRFRVYVQEGNITFLSLNSSATILNADCSVGAPLNTWAHVLISVNLANTSQRSVYVNDTAASVSWSTYSGTFDFAGGTHNYGVGAYSDGTFKRQTRLSHIYLDYTYRDMSVTANRRLFVTADLKPAAGQAALNPILYLPMSDPTQPGLNEGTGGNFTLTGTVARSGRGPNQYNAPYSDLDGAADYLSRTTAPTGIADGKQFTFHCSFQPDAISAVQSLVQFATAGLFRLLITTNASGDLDITARNSANTTILSAAKGGVFVAARNYDLTISVDLSDTSKRHVMLNGQSLAMTWGTYTNDSIQFSISSTPTYRIGNNAANTGYVNGKLGNVFFHTSYIDLSQASNLAKFVTGTGIDAKPVDLGANGELPTGTSPLIYLPMYGNNAGKNYGTGGDFTVNSGPYTGARGPNEFWGNKADFDGSTGYLTKASALTGISNSKTLSISFAMYMDALSGQMFFTMGDSSTTRNRGVLLHLVNGGTYRRLDVYAYDSAGSQILNARLPLNMVAGVLYYVQFSADLSDTAKRSAYINGAVQSVTWNTYTNSDISFSTATYLNVGRDPDNTTEFYNGKLAEFYLSNQYVDFSQEANRLKFRDAFGNPVDLTQQIEDAAIPNPAIYMRFPPTSFGTNSGTGGDFTVNGSITDAGQL